MFTGLVKAVGTVAEVRRTPSGARLVVELGAALSTAAIGDSVSVSGVCLTVTETDGLRAAFDAVEETLRRTTLGGLAPGRAVNLEPALRAGDAIGGHFVSGHVDGIATLARVRPVGDGVEMAFEADEALLSDMVLKGSVAVEGVSLTIAALEARAFGVAVIPHTLRQTTLGGIRPGARVNVETDMLVKAVRRVLGGRAASGSGLTEGFLREHGFA